MVLRPLRGDLFEFVGDSFVYGVHDTTAFLGPLPKPWLVRIKYHPRNSERFLHCFFNPETGQATSEDPRLTPDPKWERVELDELGRELSSDDPELCDYFRHRESGELRNSDPRLSPEALASRGVKLRKFSLV